MNTFSDYAFYQEEHLGKLNVMEYAVFANKAYAEIVSQTGIQSIPFDHQMKNNLSFCECELAEAFHSHSKIPEGVAGENTDGYSISFKLSAADRAKTYKEICIRHLQSPVNLMCRWI